MKKGLLSSVNLDPNKEISSIEELSQHNLSFIKLQCQNCTLFWSCGIKEPNCPDFESKFDSCKFHLGNCKYVNPSTLAITTCFKCPSSKLTEIERLFPIIEKKLTKCNFEVAKSKAMLNHALNYPENQKAIQRLQKRVSLKEKQQRNFYTHYTTIFFNGKK